MHSIMRYPGRLASVFGLVVLSGAALAGSFTKEAERGPVSCEIRVTQDRGALALTALAHGQASTRGTYAFEVSGRGTDIRQGGPFAVSPKDSSELSAVTLSGNRARYDAELKLRVDGTTVTCAKRVGSGI